MKSLDFEKMDGLIPVIVQDANTKQVLMLGFMDKEALEKTEATRRVTFYSRSKKRLWTKGETSGNYLELVKIIEDCDLDAILVLANPVGPTCHTNKYSCFGEEIFTFKKLEKIIQKRKNEMPENSWTTDLFKAGLDRIAQKVGEEATEVVIASKNSNKDEFKNEVADLIYHLIVLLAQKDVTLNEIIDTLEKRHHNS